jgi:site-specific recombinase XerD
MTVEPHRPVSAGSGGPSRAEQLVFRWLATKGTPSTRYAYAVALGVVVERPGSLPGTVPKRSASRALDWLTWCAAVGTDPLAAVNEHAALWAQGMEQAGLSPATIAQRLSAVASWYAWLVRRQHIPVSPLAGLDRPYVDPDTSKTPGLTKDQALALLAAADTTTGTQRARVAALTALLLFTGARVSESCGATLGDLGVDRGHRVLWVTRYGGARQALALPPPVISRMDAYLAGRGDLERLPALAGTARRDRPLFATVKGIALYPADVWGLVRRLGKAAGLPDELVSRMGAHSMRHSFATLAQGRGVASDATFGSSREHALPAAQREALRCPRPAGAVARLR